ncbi:MAG: dihydropteroate synthase [Actinomycetia bacterium]|nr:dihydropteroate synthase [Actinomycetes bacterium]
MLDLAPYLDSGLSPLTASREGLRRYPIGNTDKSIGDGITIMGVVNLSTLSRYRESIAISPEAAINRARRLVLEGADLVDIGCESTSINTPAVAAKEQAETLVPIVAALTESGVPVSIETYHPSVAEKCLAVGAAVINITAIPDSNDLYRVIAEHDATGIICFYGGDNPRDISSRPAHSDPLHGVATFFETQIDRAASVGLEQLVLDPGAGFTYRDLPDGPVRVRHQLQVIMQSARLNALGRPICNALPHAFTFFGEELRSGEGLFAVLAAIGGTSLFRTHEVRQIEAIVQCLALVAQPPSV